MKRRCVPWLAVRSGALVVALSSLVCAPALAEDIDVDLELVLAVDVSRSMDFYEAELQRQGYAQALRHPDFLNAIQSSGLHQKIAGTYVEWAGTHHQKTVAGWAVIDGEDSADRFAEQIQLAPFAQEYRTSISEAIVHAATLFEGNGFNGLRRVIDVSGDGANNQGGQVDVARDAVTALGITVNGLPIMTGRTNTFGWLSIGNLDQYYADCVIGGPGAFLVPVRERGELVEAIRRKLILEIAGLTPTLEARLVPVGAAPVDCLVGERAWENYRGQRGWNDPF
jgi:hypothetical protein